METQIFIDDCLNDYKKKLELRKYSLNTQQVYLCSFTKFLYHFKDQVDNLKDNNICDYVLKECQNKSNSFQNTLINSIKFYFEKVRYRKRKFYKIDRPKQQSKLPQVISHEELIKIIDSIDNLKHKTIISSAYSTGMRVSEIINLKIEDVDSKRMLLWIRNAKGNKDRTVPLSENLLTLLRKYYMEHKPEIYLFNSYIKGTQYSIGSCQAIYKKYKLNTNSTFHTLRHSCFTYLLEHGTDLRVIQKIAGHSSSKTTEIYTHVSNNLLNQVKLPI